MSLNVCPNCKRTIENFAKTEKCPFCNYKLSESKVKDNNQFGIEELLLKLKYDYKIDIFHNHQITISLMRDYAPYLNNDIKLFKIALDAGAFEIYHQMHKDIADYSNDNERLKKIKTMLCEDCFLSEHCAETVLSWFSVIFSTDLKENSFSDKSDFSVLSHNSTLEYSTTPPLNTNNSENENDEPIPSKLYDSSGNCIFNGQLENNERNGFGISYYSNGATEYEGDWLFDLRSGKGRLFDDKGNLLYFGDWLNGHMTGKGELYSEDGVYVGGFANDKKDGRGIMHYKDGQNEPQDWYLGKRIFEKQFILNVESLYDSYNQSFVEKNFNAILDLANSGNTDAVFQIGRCYELGIGVQKDVQQAKKWYTIASERDNRYAQNALKSLLAKESNQRSLALKLESLYSNYNQSFVEKNYNLILECANRGNIDAIFQIGKCHELGISVQKDVQQAMKWYAIAAENGNSCAQYKLGVLCEKENNAEKSIEYYQIALKNGELKAVIKLGRIYEEKFRKEHELDHLYSAIANYNYGVSVSAPNKYTDEKQFWLEKYECANNGYKCSQTLMKEYKKRNRFKIKDHFDRSEYSCMINTITDNLNDFFCAAEKSKKMLTSIENNLNSPPAIKNQKNFIGDDDVKFTAINDDGKEIECEILFTFESDETKKNYIVYTDNSLDSAGNTSVFASIYDPNDSTKLMPVESEEEWKTIETILERLHDEVGEEE